MYHFTLIYLFNVQFDIILHFSLNQIRGNQTWLNFSKNSNILFLSLLSLGYKINTALKREKNKSILITAANEPKIQMNIISSLYIQLHALYVCNQPQIRKITKKTQQCSKTYSKCSSINSMEAKISAKFLLRNFF